MYKKILVGYDGSSFSDAALNEAIDIAKESNGEISVVCSAESNTEIEAMAPEVKRKLEEKAGQNLELAGKKVKEAGVSYSRVELSLDTPYEAIVNTARKMGSDLILLGTHGRTGLLRLLMGSTAERVIGHAPCNVLIVRSKSQ